MNDLELDVEILLTEANFDSHLEKGTIEMNNEYFNLLQEKMARLINENQELKKQLKDYKKWYRAEILENSKLSQLWCDSKLKIIELETQQKEFIDWLDNLIVSNLDVFTEVKVCDVYAKYKEIIGEKDEI